MVTIDTWTNAAPFWDLFENEGTSPSDLRIFQEPFSAPLLVVGAGQGVLVEELSRWHSPVIGVDYCGPMLEWAFRRRGLRLIHAHAASLPFGSDTFSTVIVPTGVLHAECGVVNQQILRECARVARPHASLLIGFPSPSPQRLKAMRAIGICCEWHQDWNRIVDIWETQADSDALSRLLAKWLGIGLDKARAEVAGHFAAYQAIADNLNVWADRLGKSGRCPRAFFRKEVSFSQHFFPPNLIRFLLSDTPLQLLSISYSACQSATHVLCRKSLFARFPMTP